MRRSDLAPLSAESWVMPGSAAETRADACRSNGGDPPGPGAAALLAGGRFRRRGLRLGVRLRSRLLVATVVVLGELGHLGQHRPWRGTSGRRDRSGATRSGRSELPAVFAVCSFAAFTAWRPRLETASQPASRPRPTSGRHHGLRAALRRCLRRCRDITSTSRPRPADWVALLFPPFASSETNRGPMAWRQPDKLRPPPTRRPASTPPSPHWVLASRLPVAEGPGRV